MNHEEGGQHANHKHHEHTFRHRWPFLKDLEKLGDEYLVRKAPWPLPHKWKQFISKLLPVLVLIVAICVLPGVLGGFLSVLGIAGKSAANRGLYNIYRGAAYPIILLQLIITAAIAFFFFKSFHLLSRRLYVGWVYVFYAILLGFVANLLSGDIFPALIEFVISMYLLFQIKELYH